MSEYQPQPTPANTVVCGHARFVLLTERLLRLEWSATGEFEDRATLAVVHRALPPVRFTKKETAKGLSLHTGSFSLSYTDNGKPFSPANLQVSFKVKGQTVVWKPGLRDPQNLGATLRTLDGIKGGKRQIMKEKTPGKWVSTGKWKPVDMGHGFISRSGWALVDDSANVILTADPEWVEPRPTGERRDWYLFLHGHDYKAAVADAARVFGRQPMPPRFAFGYWWSRYWAYSDREIEQLTMQFDRHAVPLDVMVIDMDWHLEGWTGYTWDRRYFPDPVEFLNWLKARDLKITLNLHPAQGVGKQEEQFGDMARAMELNPKKADHVPFDITDPKFVDAYFRILHHPQEKAGVDFWWMDWQQGQSTKVPGLDPLPWINHLHWRDMELNSSRGKLRPLIFSRFGGVGAGRYCVGFSGDTHSVWETLQFQPYFTATAANVLYGYWSHDIGGHMPGEIEPELYTRWIQFGVHSPVLRTHTSKNPKAERRVWEYPEPYSAIMMDALRERYELVPYIYTESRRAYESALSLCLPLYYDYPEEAAAYTAKGQYLFGSQMLVAPVVTRVSAADEMAEVKVWLPPGRWFDTARGCFEKGGQVIRRRYLVSECPVFVRPGALVPGQRAPSRLRPGSYAELVVTAYPGGDGEYRLYEDDGVSRDYQQDRCAWIPLKQKRTPSGRTITIGAAEGRFDGFLARRPVDVRLPGSVPPKRVRVGKEELPWSLRPADGCWSYDGDNATVIIRLASVDLTQDTLVTVTEAAGTASLADGLKGLMARLARISYYNTISMAGLILHPQERLGVDAAQTGNRITRRPEEFKAEVTALRRKMAALPGMLTALARGIDPWGDGKPSPERAARCRKAIAILKSTRQEKKRD